MPELHCSKTLTPDEVKHALDRLWYEIQMLRSDYNNSKSLKKTFSEKDRSVLDLLNAFEESYAIHLRNLILFFFPTDQAQADDIIAKDLVTDWQRDIPAELEYAGKTIGKHGADMSYSETKRKIDWRQNRYYSSINSIIDEYVEHLKSEELFNKHRTDRWENDPDGSTFRFEKAE